MNKRLSRVKNKVRMTSKKLQILNPETGSFENLNGFDKAFREIMDVNLI